MSTLAKRHGLDIPPLVPQGQAYLSLCSEAVLHCVHVIMKRQIRVHICAEMYLYKCNICPYVLFMCVRAYACIYVDYACVCVRKKKACVHRCIACRCVCGMRPVPKQTAAALEEDAGCNSVGLNSIALLSICQSTGTRLAKHGPPRKSTLSDCGILMALRFCPPHRFKLKLSDGPPKPPKPPNPNPPPQFPRNPQAAQPPNPSPPHPTPPHPTPPHPTPPHPPRLQQLLLVGAHLLRLQSHPLPRAGHLQAPPAPRRTRRWEAISRSVAVCEALRKV